jgi:hypothetical protein
MSAELEKAFSATVQTLLGNPAKGGLRDYAGWLGRHVPLPHLGKSAISGRAVWVPPNFSFLRKDFEPSRIIHFDEMDKANKTAFSAKDLEGASVRDMVNRIIRPVAYYCGEFRYGKSEDMEETSGGGGGMHVFHSEDIYHSVKNIAYSYFVIFSENVFGSHNLHYSRFCINCYSSVRITRGFEIDGCANSSDVFFCHNSEGLSNCMFCFNAKSLRYAIGNVELGREKYLRVRDAALAGLSARLEKDKTLGMDIYNIGCAKNGHK